MSKDTTVPQAALGMSVMNGRRIDSHGKVRRDSAFSLTELVVVLAVGLILMAVAMPTFLRAYHSYQLNNAATQVADILRFTRYEAIRRNKQMNCVFGPSTADPTVTSAWITDASGNAQTGVSGLTIIFGANGSLVNAGSVPGAGAFPGAANLGPIVPATVPASGATLQFDARGALTPGNVTVFFLSATGAPDAGYRAVLLTPAGSLQIWTGDASGNWRQLQ
jgi:prepilin-type N-terminal cleavage/methylation domain-containing protein